jgi:hypothetical protein
MDKFSHATILDGAEYCFRKITKTRVLTLRFIERCQEKGVRFQPEIDLKTLSLLELKIIAQAIWDGVKEKDKQKVQ